MKTNYTKGITSSFKIGFWLISLFFSVTLQAQEDEEVQDSTATGYSAGKIELKNPISVLEAYTYDPILDRYVYTNTVGGFNINYPVILTPAEYEELVLRESMRAYFKQKSDAIDGKKDGSNANKKDLLPRYYVNSSFFETLFGGNTIDVKPTGSVEMDLGVRYTKQDNPSLSPRNRTTTTFDFDQRISMSLMGKVGTRLAVNANYDTESTFAFQNLIKLEYTPTEDDIIQKIEVGNVSLPLNSSLIRGAQSLFGVKAQFQFGKTTVTGIFSEQKSQTRTVTAEGGGTVQNFELFALDYDADRHFFLSQYFRDKYDESLINYPLINSRVQITRIEVWVTNRQNRVSTTDNNLRNIIALQDLGEAPIAGLDVNQVVSFTPPGNIFIAPVGTPAKNSNNRFDPDKIGTAGYFLNSNIREIATASSGFSNLNGGVVSEGTDYSKLENARKLSASEFTYHPQLGYISLAQKLTNDEVLAVAYQYTIGGEVYQVGEFGTDGVDATQVSNGIPTTQSLILKMLKSNLTNVNKPVWNLMMKNIYSLPGAYQLEQEDFKLNIMYTDPSPLNYITPANPSSPIPYDENGTPTPLLRVFNVDRLNYTNDPQVNGDGFFDFVPGLTVDQQNGRIIFTTVEPFGEHLFKKLNTAGSGADYDLPLTYNANQTKYVYTSMYRSTQAAALQDSDKNKFQLKGKFKSTSGEGIAIGAINVPQGSVTVTSGGRVLIEGVDYTVNYQRGLVQIVDASLQASGTPIEISLENNAVFGQQTRRFFGVNVEHKFNDKFVVGATLLKMSEKPFTQKSNYGQESVNNTIFGVNTNYSTEVPFLTRLVNKLPNIDTDVPSNISFRGEIAYLKPDTPKADQFDGESTIYVDDFEGSQTTIDMRSPFSWSLSSVPVTNAQSGFNFGQVQGGTFLDGLPYGYKRSKLAWYSIDPTFYVQRPSGVSEDDLKLYSTRRIYSRELYPETDIAVGQQTVINTLDLSYFPQERGPYNFNPAAAATNGFTPAEAQENFGGIMRAINSTNFEQSNVEYIQFWVLDPYNGGTTPQLGSTPQTNVGKLVFNLGEISEDVLKDGRKQYENGLPGAGSNQPTLTTVWGKIPISQSLIYAFDTDTGNRSFQDVGFDGLNDADEAAKFPQFASQPDPAADNYQYFLSATGDVIQRYKNYNGVQGNSPVELGDTNRGSTTLPDTEDINRDNTMNEINAYYEYAIDIVPGMVVGSHPYITDVKETIANLPGSGTTGARWIQFKIPVTQPTNTIGTISDFRSIRFMRMFVTGFSEQVTLRFGALDLVRGEWRRYVKSLDPNEPVDNINDQDDTALDVLAVNIQENGDRSPIKYVAPPGVTREQLYNSNTIINQNEQSLSLRVTEKDPAAPLGGLEPEDSRGVFKNVSVDMRQFKKIKMFLHAEALPNGTDPQPLIDDQMVAFLRFGNDFTENFYQIEIPLKVTPQNASLRAEEIWPESNEIDVQLAILTKLKILAMSASSGLVEDALGIKYAEDFELDPSLAGRSNAVRLGIKGNPNFGLVRTIMVGLKNRAADNIRGEVWFNELRLADMDNKGGMAAIASFDGNLADFATISATGRISTQGFGSLEQGPNERSREDIQQYDIVTNVSLGKLLPKKWGINLPFNYGIGEETITPEYDPFNQDIRLDQLLDNTADAATRENIESRAIDYTKRTSINFIGVKKERAPEQKQHFYDPENLTLSYSYNETEHHDYEIKDLRDQQVRTSADYNFAFQPKAVEPFKKSKFMKKSSYWKLLSDFNFNYLPTSVSFSSNIVRQYNKQTYRDVDVIGVEISPLYRRNYMFNYQYGFNYNLTKALKINYTASTNNIVRNYLDENNVPMDDFTIWDDYWNIGEANQHIQQLVVNYDLPLNKIPALAFIKSTYSYTGDYSWQRSTDALSVIETEDGVFNLGNTIQNAGSHRLNTALNMDLFYKYIGLTKKPKVAARPGTVAPPKPGEKVAAQNKPKAAEGNIFLDGLIGVLTSVKNVQINYTQNEGTVLPGFTQGVGFLGTTKPSLGFVLGSQSDIRYEAAKRGWLTNYQDFNQNYTQVSSKMLSMTANVDLFPDFKIDLAAERSYTENFSEQYDVSEDGLYNSRSPYNYGNFSISTAMIKTSFGKSDENSSAAFDDFRTNRLTVANRLASSYYGTSEFPTTADGYPVGFGKGSQAVLLPSFLAAYTGADAGGVSLGAFRNIPIPNWTIKYNGLMRYKFFKDRFKRFSLQHAYRATYTVNSFRSNFEYDQNRDAVDASGNLLARTIISNVNLVEQFNPLIRMDFELKSSFKILAEMKKDRSLSMSFDNNLLTEVKGLEYTLGMGYRFKDVVITSRLADNPTNTIRSDINLKADFTMRNSNTIVRYLDYDNNQLAGGQNIWSLKLTADYAFSKNLTAIFYYDHSFSKAVISTSFPLTNIRSGFTLRYNFGN